MALSCYILEGTWWGNREVPQILPYFQALDISGYNINLSHRTIRNVDDIAYWVGKIRKNENAFLYFACHGDNLELSPTNDSRISEDELEKSLRKTKENAISFLHFGCCEMISEKNRRKTLTKYLIASKAKWVSGYSKEIEWLRSTLLDLALIADFAIPYHKASNKKNVRMYSRGKKFFKNYKLSVDILGFSGGYCNKKGEIALFPSRRSKL